MKRFNICLICSFLAIASCQRDVMPGNEMASGDIYASIEKTLSTKTVLDHSNDILWASGDQLAVFNRSSMSSLYRIREEFAGKNDAEFSFSESASGSGVPLDHIVALYPYSESLECVNAGVDSYEIRGFSLPSVQNYAEDSFGPGAMPMAAVSEGHRVAFMNICGGVKLSLKGTQTLSSIRIDGNNNERLSGPATITAYADGTAPAINLAETASASVILDCPDGVRLDQTQSTDFIIMLPPTEFTSGFTVTLTDAEGRTYSVETSRSNTVIRSSLLVMPAVSLDASDILNFWDGTIPDSSPLAKEQGSYMIDEAADLAWLSVKANADGLEPSSAFVLKANLDMSHQSALQPLYLPEGSQFKGEGHTIKGLKEALLGDVTDVSVSDLTLAESEVASPHSHKGALVNILRGSAVFSNVTVRNASVTASEGAAGAMVGYIVRKESDNREEQLEVTFDNCRVVNTAVEGSVSEGHFVGLLSGYDNGEVLRFNANCSLVYSGRKLNSAYVEGNEGQWLADNDYTRYDAWLGAEEYYRAKVFYGAERFVTKWDGETMIQPLLADPAFDDSAEHKVVAGENRFVIYSPYDLVGVRELVTATPSALYFKENVDLDGPGPDGVRWVPAEYTRSSNESSDDRYLKAFNTIDLLDGQNHGIYNMCIRSYNEVNAAFIKGARAGAQTVHKNLSFHNCQTATPVIELKSGSKVQDASFGSILIDYTNPRDGGSYLMENIHAYGCRVFALQSIGILARQLEAGTVRNCTVNDCYIENCKFERHLEPYEKSMEIAGNTVTVSTGFYSYGEIGGLFGFIQGGAEVSDCHVRGTTICAFGQNDKEADITGSGFLGQIGAAAVKGLGYFLVPGRHVSTLVGDIRTYKGETITITGCTVDENTRCIQDYHKHSDAYPYIGQAYYIQFSDTKGKVIVDGKSLTLADCNRNTRR